MTLETCWDPSEIWSEVWTKDKKTKRQRPNREFNIRPTVIIDYWSLCDQYKTVISRITVQWGDIPWSAPITRGKTTQQSKQNYQHHQILIKMASKSKFMTHHVKIDWTFREHHHPQYHPLVKVKLMKWASISLSVVYFYQSQNCDGLLVWKLINLAG